MRAVVEGLEGEEPIFEEGEGGCLRGEGRGGGARLVCRWSGWGREWVFFWMFGSVDVAADVMRFGVRS